MNTDVISEDYTLAHGWDPCYKPWMYLGIEICTFGSVLWPGICLAHYTVFSVLVPQLWNSFPGLRHQGSTLSLMFWFHLTFNNCLFLWKSCVFCMTTMLQFLGHHSVLWSLLFSSSASWEKETLKSHCRSTIYIKYINQYIFLPKNMWFTNFKIVTFAII